MKRTSRREMLIQKKLHKILPKYIPAVLSYKNGIMTSKKCGISLKKWLLTHNFNDSILMQIIRNVRAILTKIKKRYPNFRHMDLHLDNVLFNKGRVLFTDFGISKFSYKVSSVYDVHFFLNSLRHFLLKKRWKGRTMVYLNKVLPNGMRGFSGKYVKNFRLRDSESAADIAKRLLKV